MKNLNIETLDKISTLCRYLHHNCCDFTYADRHGFIIPEIAQKEKLQEIKDFGTKIKQLIDEL